MGQLCTRDETEVANQDVQPNQDGQAPVALKPAQAPREEPHPVDSFANPPQNEAEPNRDPFNYPAQPEQPVHHQQPAVDPEIKPEQQTQPQPVPATVIDAPAPIHQSVASDWHNYAEFPKQITAVQEIVSKRDPIIKDKLQQYAAHYQTTQGTVQTLQHKSDGRFYHGETWRDVPHGFGKMILKDGTLYEGFFTDGQPDRYVRLIRPNREVYHGEFSNQKQNGNGARTEPSNATTMCDSWLNGVENGKTTKTDKDGRKVFEGSYKDGRMIGNCFFYSENEKCTYEGPFVNGILEGQGKKTYDNGRSYQGTFVKGAESGSGTLTFVDGRRWEGTVINGRPDGTGKFYTEENKVVTQTWKDGKRI